MNNKRKVTSAMCVVLLVCLALMGNVHATEYNDHELNNTVVVECESESSQATQLEMWGTLSEAKIGYGLQYTYGCVGYDAGGGYFICYCLKFDNTMIYFGCYSL